MILASHIAFGAGMASQTSSLSFAFLLGFLSHFLLDLIPHWDYLNKKDVYSLKKPFSEKQKVFLKIGTDLFLGLALLFIFLTFRPGKIAVMILGALASIIPDSMQYFYYLHPGIPWLRKIQKFQEQLHAPPINLPKPIGILISLAAVLIGYLIAL